MFCTQRIELAPQQQQQLEEHTLTGSRVQGTGCSGVDWGLQASVFGNTLRAHLQSSHEHVERRISTYKYRDQNFGFRLLSIENLQTSGKECKLPARRLRADARTVDLSSVAQFPHGICPHSACSQSPRCIALGPNSDHIANTQEGKSLKGLVRFTGFGSWGGRGSKAFPPDCRFVRESFRGNFASYSRVIACAFRTRPRFGFESCAPQGQHRLRLRHSLSRRPWPKVAGDSRDSHTGREVHRRRPQQADKGAPFVASPSRVSRDPSMPKRNKGASTKAVSTLSSTTFTPTEWDARWYTGGTPGSET